MVENVGVDVLYIDVMDGQFVFNLLFGMSIVVDLWLVMLLMLDCYLMIMDLEWFVGQFVKVGVDLIGVYVESICYIYYVL